MLSQLPTILKCLHCGRDGLELGSGTKTYTLRNGDEEIELVEQGTVECPRCHTIYYVEDGILNMLPHTIKKLNPAQLSGQWQLTAWGYERPWRMKALTWLGGRDWPPSEEINTVLETLADVPVEKLTTHNEFAFYLDLACSNAFYGRNIACAIKNNHLATGTANGTVVAVDNSWPMLQEAKKRIAQVDVSGYVSLVRADAENLPFIAEAFVGIGGGAILNEFQHPEKSLREARRVLAPSGNFVCMNQVASSNTIGYAIQQFLGLTSGLKFFKKPELAEMFKQADLHLERQEASGVITINHLTAN